MAMGFKHGVSGGAPLGIHIVTGTTRPVSPKENTIWANSSTGAASWAISPVQPDGAAGRFWVKTAPDSDVVLDVLKGKDRIVIQPRSVYEYSNGSWVERSAECYRNGMWTAFPAAWDGYYFNAGDQCTDITGGWTTSGWVSDTANVNTFAKVNADSMYVLGQASSMGAVGTVRKVDLTNIDTLTATISQKGGTVRLCICDGNNVSKAVASKANTSVGSFDIGLDVSGYSGSYHIVIYGAGAYSEATITSVRGE